jgi:hypothetical protein
MSVGYSVKLVHMNNEASDELVGVRLGRVCINNDVPVVDVANRLGVSRQTVYNWFCGGKTPQDQTVDAILDYMAELSLG